MSTCFVCGIYSFLKILGSFYFHCSPCVIPFPDLLSMPFCLICMTWKLATLPSFCFGLSPAGAVLLHNLGIPWYCCLPLVWISLHAHTCLHKEPLQLLKKTGGKWREISEQKFALINCFFLQRGEGMCTSVTIPVGPNVAWLWKSCLKKL